MLARRSINRGSMCATTWSKRRFSIEPKMGAKRRCVMAELKKNSLKPLGTGWDSLASRRLIMARICAVALKKDPCSHQCAVDSDGQNYEADSDGWRRGYDSFLAESSTYQ